ncbi:MAG: hypothetical protein EAZ66_00015, partial [Alphaproteobacteria bacterium]
MDYISKISEIYFHLNDQMIELSEDRIQFFPYDTFKEASESDLIPFEYHDEPESFWSVLSNGMQGYYADEFGEVLNQSFQTNDLGYVTYYLGIQIERQDD